MNTIETDRQYVAPTYRRESVVFVKGKGSLLFDETGKEYIDFGSGIGVNALGVGDPEWTDAVTCQIEKLPHISNLYHTAPCAELAAELVGRTGMAKVFFCNSGTEANEAAIKACRKYSFDRYGRERYKIVTLERSFHGRTLAALSATGQPDLQTPFVPVVEGFRYVKAGDLAAMREAIGDDTAAVMIEMIQGEGGVNVLDAEYVAAVAAMCKEKDVLLVVDEVQTGNGRTGTLYAYQGYGIEPDLVTTAKGLGNGLPIGAVLFNRKTACVLSAGSHGSTFGGNPVATAGALAVLKKLTPDFLAEVERKGAYMRMRLAAMKGVKGVTGKGLMIGVAVEDAAKVKSACLTKGLVVLTAKDKVRLLPALNIPDELIDRGLNIMEEALQ